MLQYKTVNAKTLEFLRKIQAIEEFNPLRLVGGTSLALQIGHRISVDLDFFGEHNLPEFKISSLLSNIGNTKLIHKTNSILIYSIEGVKVDIVNYPYKWLEDAVSVEGIKLAGLKDIAAMKLSAVTGRGSIKDFIDIWFLLQYFPLSEQLELFKEKYPQATLLMVLKSLSYFEDAEKEKPPKMIKQMKWENLKDTLRKEINKIINQ